MEKTSNKAEHVINEAGCGPFQVVLVVWVSLIPKIGTIFTMMFMVFGNYNPGWRCLDDDSNTTAAFYSRHINHSSDNSISISAPGVIDSTVINNKTATTSRSHLGVVTAFSTYVNETVKKYNDDSCEIFKACQNVEFNPSASTVVTEWGLICDKAWVPSFMISMQMVGVVVGAIISGQIVGIFGRKKMFNASLALMGAFNLIAIFSTYWQVLVVMQFLIGGGFASLINLYTLFPAEFLNSKWRTRDAAIPGRSIGGVLFGIVVIVAKDWKILSLTIGVFFIIAFIPSVIWVPESLRWLEVKSKQEEFEKVVKKIVTMNKMKTTPEYLDQLRLSPPEENQNRKKFRAYSVLDLFRKGYRLYSVIIYFTWIMIGLVYYAITFGVKAMPGNFYVNIIALTAGEIPYSILPMHMPNIIGRKKASMLFIAIAVVALFTGVGFGMWASEDIKAIAIIITIAVTRMNCEAAFATNAVLSAELYPTVVRSIALGFCGLMTLVGGILAPLLIPEDSKDINVCYSIMGAGCLLCCLALLKIPETKGRAMKGDFDEGDYERL